MPMIGFIFYGFVAIIFTLLYICNKILSRNNSVYIENWILIAASYIFVLYVNYLYAIILAMLTLSTWYFAKKKNYYVVGIVISLISLAVFKYTNFFIESFMELTGNDVVLLKIILPLGISFYTFSAIGYLIDVKRNVLSPRNFQSVALYLAFFPKLTSGPIQKSNDFFRQMDIRREIGWNTFSLGIQIYMFGLFKKIVLADRLSVFVNQVYETPMVFGSLTVFFAAISYSLQIYFDFSGYSDMAVGIAKILGFDLPKNFNLPYVSHNVTELWKRWHISLSSWLQEYLYISLGGNKKGAFKTYVNLILTMLLGGIWHGANWTYAIWGLLHGVALAVHKAWMKITDSPMKQHSSIASIMSIVFTFLFTTLCWIFFRAESFTHAMIIINRIVACESRLEQPYLWSFVSLAILCICSMISFIKSKNICVKTKYNISIINAFYPVFDLSKFWSLVIFFVFCGLTLCLAYTGGSPFIYGNY